jgi:hypothetical protein
MFSIRPWNEDSMIGSTTTKVLQKLLDVLNKIMASKIGESIREIECLLEN